MAVVISEKEHDRSCDFQWHHRRSVMGPCVLFVCGIISITLDLKGLRISYIEISSKTTYPLSKTRYWEFSILLFRCVQMRLGINRERVYYILSMQRKCMVGGGGRCVYLFRVAGSHAWFPNSIATSWQPQSYRAATISINIPRVSDSNIPGGKWTLDTSQVLVLPRLSPTILHTYPTLHLLPRPHLCSVSGIHSTKDPRSYKRGGLYLQTFSTTTSSLRPRQFYVASVSPDMVPHPYFAIW